jgi:methionyl-tRNA formyltransferase
MTQSTPIVFFGSDDFSLPTLTELVTAHWPIALVVTKPERGSGRTRTDNPILNFAQGHGLAVITPDSFTDDVIATIKAANTPVAVLASYGKILPDEVLNLFKLGIINVHPSLLPRWRGPSPVESALLHGDKTTGVSIMRLTAEMDAGPIYAQRESPVEPSATQITLRAELADQGAKLLTATLPQIIDGSVQPQAQSGSPTYSKLITKQDGQIDWTAKAATIERQVRAYHAWPRCRAQIADVDVIILAAKVDDLAQDVAGITTENNRLLVGCGQGSIEITRLIPAGKKAMSGADFIRGYLSPH